MVPAFLAHLRGERIRCYLFCVDHMIDREMKSIHLIYDAAVTCMNNKPSILCSKGSKSVLQMIFLTQWMYIRFSIDEYQQTLPAGCINKSLQ